MNNVTDRPHIGSESGLLDFARELIRTPSPNPGGDERAVVGLIQDALRSLGLPVGSVITEDSSRPNLLVTMDFGPGGTHLGLCGHLDTKPVGNTPWDVNPYGAVIEGDRLFGLGACDMKGALAAMVYAAAGLSRGGLSIGQLSLLFTADEENGARYGSKYLAENAPLPVDMIVIGEPGGMESDWDSLHLVSRGIMGIKIDVFGDSGHAGLSDRLELANASVEGARLVAALKDRFHPSFPAQSALDARPTVTPGVRLRGGDGFGMSPTHLQFMCEIRTLPGMQRDCILEELNDFVSEESRTNPFLRASVKLAEAPVDWLPPTAVEANSKLARGVERAIRGVTGVQPVYRAFPGSTDASWLQGYAGIPTLPAVGPGLLSLAHQPNEYVSVGGLMQSQMIYDELARNILAEECYSGTENG